MDAETLAEDADRYVAWEHALANGGCVPAAAYQDACEALRRVEKLCDDYDASDEETDAQNMRRLVRAALRGEEQ